MKEIVIIPLAKRKMERRGIAEAWVEAALTSPDQIVEGHGGRSVAQQRRRIVGRKGFFELFSRTPATATW